jgi:hypothetical protein
MSMNKPDAQEWLESLQQVGEGWWRQVALAIRMGAHKALGMDQREFAQRIGQRLIDPNDAIIELANELKYRGRPNIQGIADVLGVGTNRVEMVLAEAGLIEVTPHRQAMIEQRTTKPNQVDSEPTQDAEKVGSESTYIDSEVVEDDESDQLREQVETLKAKAKDSTRKIKELKAEIVEAQEDLYQAEAKARKEAEAGLTKQERERAKKEADAWANEQGAEIIASMAHVFVVAVVDSLREAGEALQQLVERGGITAEYLAELEKAHAVFVEQFNVARMSELA